MTELGHQNYALWIFCGGEADLSPSEIAQFIKEGVYFDARPGFFPPIEGPAATSRDWSTIRVTYDPGRASIVLRRVSDPREVKSAKQAAHEALERVEEEPGAAAGVMDAVEEVETVLAVDINRDDLTDDAWFMIDSLEAHIASGCGGVIWAPGDGFYDSNLQLIVGAG